MNGGHFYRNTYKERAEDLFEFLYQQVPGGNGKAIPLQAWTGPEGSRRLRLPHFKTVGT